MIKGTSSWTRQVLLKKVRRIHADSINAVSLCRLQPCTLTSHNIKAPLLGLGLLGLCGILAVDVHFATCGVTSGLWHCGLSDGKADG